MITVRSIRAGAIAEQAVAFASSVLELDGAVVEVSIFDAPPKAYTDLRGYCSRVGDKFFVFVFQDDPKNIVKTIFHELTHVRQMMDGELSYDSSNMMIRWIGQPYPHAEVTKLSDADYCSLPWEEEAMIVEEELFQAFERQDRAMA